MWKFTLSNFIARILPRIIVAFVLSRVFSEVTRHTNNPAITLAEAMRRWNDRESKGAQS